MQPGQFLSVPEHTGLILCSDGVRLFKSCGQSMWPIEMAVTSLPPKIRMNANNLLLGGVWLGPVKPDMKVILKPIRDKIEELNLHGVTVKTQNGTKQVRACLFLGVFDLPAKAMATNMTQYNGRFSCTYCLDKGEHVSQCPVFLPEYAHQPRTTQSVEQCAAQALECGQPIKGVKGESVLSTHINIVDAVPVDYMHTILEEVVKKLIEFSTDTKHIQSDTTHMNFREHPGLSPHTVIGKLQNSGHGYSTTQFLFSVISYPLTMCITCHYL